MQTKALAKRRDGEVEITGGFDLTHQEVVDCSRGLSSFPLSPYHQRLPASSVSCRKDAWHRGFKAVGVGLDIATPGQRDFKVAEQPVSDGMKVANCQQNKIAGDLELGPGISTIACLAPSRPPEA